MGWMSTMKMKTTTMMSILDDCTMLPLVFVNPLFFSIILTHLVTVSSFSSVQTAVPSPHGRLMLSAASTLM
jgi:hypothetical protein